MDSGYAIIPNVLARRDCEAIVRLAKSHADAYLSPIIDLEKKAPFLAEIVINDPQIIEHVENALESKVMPVGSMFHFKEPGTPYAAQAWNPHQDNSYLQCEYGKSLSAILALSHTSKTNGGLYVYDGSHRFPIMNYTPRQTFNTSRPGNEIDMTGLEFKKNDLVFEQGSLYLQHGNLIHGSYPNWSMLPRYHLGIIYCAQGADYRLGKSRRDEQKA